MKHRTRIVTKLWLPLSFSLVSIAYSSWVINVNIDNLTPLNYGGSIYSPNYPVAYIASDTSKKFNTIERALAVAKEKIEGGSSDEVVRVIPMDSTIYITGDCEIASGVTLVLPYKDNIRYTDQPSESGKGNFPSSSNLMLSVETLPGVEIINNGKIEICGKVTGGGGGSAASGQTYSDYAQILLGKDSNIISNGDILCNGFIRNIDDSDSGSSSLILNERSSLEIPFVIRDFRGGSTTYALVKNNGADFKSSLFNQFECRNISTLLLAKYGSEIYGIVNIYMSMDINTKVNLIGNTDSFLIQFTSPEFSSFTCKYDEVNELMDMVFYGGAQINSLDISISSYSYKTSSGYLPLSFRQKVELKRADDQVEDATFTLPNRYKMLPGSYLKIDEGCFVDAFKILTLKGGSTIVSGGGTVYPIKTDAVCINNGTLDVDEIGGYINTTVDGAILNVNIGSVLSSFEPDERSGSTTSTKIKTWQKLREYLTLDYLDQEGVKSFKNRYTSQLDSELKGYWVAEDTDLHYYVDTNVSVNGYDNSNAPSYKLKIGESSEVELKAEDTCRLLTGDSVVITRMDDNTTIKEGDADVNGQTLATSQNREIMVYGKAQSDGTCLVFGTKIRKFDGTLINVEDIRTGDEVLVFDHLLGKLSKAKILFNDFEPEGVFTVINLIFSNGAMIKETTEHAFFDVDLRKYIYIDENNLKDFIGHNFLSLSDDGASLISVRLVAAYLTKEFNRVCSPVSEKHLNYFASDLLSIPGGIGGLFNIFELDAALKYEKIAMRKDIERYGLFEFEDFKDIVNEHMFEVFNGKYLKVSIGKNLINLETIQALADRYSKYFI
jgi:hypothetical protein